MAKSITIPDDQVDDAVARAAEFRGEKPVEEEKPDDGAAQQQAQQDQPEGDEEKPKGDLEIDSGESEGDGEKKLGDALDFQGLLDEWEQNAGDLSPESREAVAKVLEEAGFPADTLDTYILGLNAMKELRTSKVHAIAGSAENYAAAISWAKSNLTDAEIEAFDAAITGSEGQAMLAAEGLIAKWRAAGVEKPEAEKEGSEEPNLRNQGNPNRGGGGGRIKSRAQLQELIRDPKYRTDAAFRAQVQADLKVAMESGEYLTTDN